LINFLIDYWDNLFFHKINCPFLGLFRILIGIVCLCKLFLLFKNRYEYFGEKGLYPHNIWRNHWKNHLSIFLYLKPNNINVDIIFFFSAISFFLLTIGFCTEVFCFISFFLFTSLNNRNCYIFNSGDSLLRILLFLMIFSSCGFYMSLDNIVYEREQLNALINPLTTRFIQIVVIKVYIHAFYSKLLFSNFWREGTGLYYSISNLWVARYNLNPYINKFIFIFLNYATLIAESALVIGLLFKETSTICVFILIFLHLLFEILLRINLFGVIMIACLLLFLRSDLINWVGF
jgi:hypothetical protein